MTHPDSTGPFIARCTGVTAYSKNPKLQITVHVHRNSDLVDVKDYWVSFFDTSFSLNANGSISLEGTDPVKACDAAAAAVAPSRRLSFYSNKEDNLNSFSKSIASKLENIIEAAVFKIPAKPSVDTTKMTTPNKEKTMTNPPVTGVALLAGFSPGALDILLYALFSVQDLDRKVLVSVPIVYRRGAQVGTDLRYVRAGNLGTDMFVPAGITFAELKAALEARFGDVNSKKTPLPTSVYSWTENVLANCLGELSAALPVEPKNTEKYTKMKPTSTTTAVSTTATAPTPVEKPAKVKLIHMRVAGDGELSLYFDSNAHDDEGRSLYRYVGVQTDERRIRYYDDRGKTIATFNAPDHATAKKALMGVSTEFLQSLRFMWEQYNTEEQIDDFVKALINSHLGNVSNVKTLAAKQTPVVKEAVVPKDETRKVRVAHLAQGHRYIHVDFTCGRKYTLFLNKTEAEVHVRSFFGVTQRRPLRIVQHRVDQDILTRTLVDRLLSMKSGDVWFPEEEVLDFLVSEIELSAAALMEAAVLIKKQTPVFTPTPAFKKNGEILNNSLKYGAAFIDSYMEEIKQWNKATAATYSQTKPLPVAKEAGMVATKPTVSNEERLDEKFSTKKKYRYKARGDQILVTDRLTRIELTIEIGKRSASVYREGKKVACVKTQFPTKYFGSVRSGDLIHRLLDIECVPEKLVEEVAHHLHRRFLIDADYFRDLDSPDKLSWRLVAFMNRNRKTELIVTDNLIGRTV